VRRILNLTISILILMTCAAIVGASAAEPDAASIVKRMKQALEPARPSVRVMTLKVNSGDGLTTQWTLGQARAHESGTDWMLTTVLKPADAKGITLLAKEKPGEATVTYWYLPALHLVRELTPLAGYEPFFGTDFTYQDLSFVRLGGHEKLAGTETHKGVKAYKLEETLTNNPYFSKAVTWVAVDTGLPVERDFYDVDGKLLQKESFEKVSTIDKVPTIMKMVMSNVQSGGSSEIDVTSVKYDKQAPPELFNPKHLARVAADSFWQTALH
jgi:Outer membrane lipoprotein-sorting protein